MYAAVLLTYSASQDGKLIVWDALSAAKRCVIPLHSAWIMTCAFEPTVGNVVACGGLDNACSVYKLKNEPIHSGMQDIELNGHDGYVSCCRFVDETKIVSSSGDGSCIVWDLETKKPMMKLLEHQSDVMSLGKQAVFMPKTLSSETQLKRCITCVWIDISPQDSNLFVSGSCDTVALLWDIRQPQPVMEFGENVDGHESDINSVKFSQDGHQFVTGSDDSTCRFALNLETNH